MTSSRQLGQKQSATEIDLCAADWLQRQSFWAWGAEDQAALEAWLAEARAHRIAYWRQKAVWENAQRLTALCTSMSRPEHRGSAKNSRPLLLRIAAAAIVASAVGASYYQFSGAGSGNEKTFTTLVGGRETVTLADGSQIELNTNTVLRVRADKAMRLVTLEQGEAFFDIKHNATRPFVVTAAGHRVTDLGTKFAVKDAPDRLEVTLFQGKARLESTDKLSPPNTTILSPGEVAIATPQSVTVIKKPQKELADQLGWRRGMLTFYRATLADAAHEFNRYNTRKIVVVDNAAEAELIDGTFPVNNVDLFARFAHAVLGAHVENKSNDIVISY